MKTKLVMLFCVMFLVIFTGSAIADDLPSLWTTEAVCEVGEISTFDVYFTNTYIGVDAIALSLDLPDSGIKFVSTEVHAEWFTVLPYDSSDSDGELDMAAYQLAPLNDGALMTVTVECLESGTFPVQFSADPAPSFGADGQSVLGHVVGSEIVVSQVAKAQKSWIIFLPTISSQ